MKTIVISAVNLVEAGTLAILRECLRYLSALAAKGEYRVVAIVFSRDLVEYPNIEYIETKWPKKRWLNRLWYEYVEMKRISKQLGDVYLWFALHDTSPNVVARRRAVYCHNSYFAYQWKMHDLLFAPKIALFAIFTTSIYRPNIKKNDFIIVQQDWFRTAMHRIFDLPLSKIIVARPESPVKERLHDSVASKDVVYSFLFAGSPNSHKNFEVICKAAEILENEYGIRNFKVFLTVKGDENKYAAWLKKNWGTVKAIDFVGFMKAADLQNLFETSDCMIFPSKVESWGLPISEFSQYRKPMLLADLPYAHETAEGSLFTAFFDPNNSNELAVLMKRLIDGNNNFLTSIQKRTLKEPFVDNWEDLFTKLLK